MVDYNNVITPEGVTRTEITGEELTKLQADKTTFANKSGERKLEVIKQLRLERLKETDWMSNSDVTMPDNIKTWRQSLRDIPANHTDEAAYDLLLERDNNNNLTHSIWSKP
tara:strand:+ start:21402 stop:21734 length:333 start_codon:yes stop_codon:yes gene_type:complete